MTTKTLIIWCQNGHLCTSMPMNGKSHFSKRGPLTAVAAQKYVKDLNEEERTLLMSALSKRNELLARKAGLPLIPPPSIHELTKLALHQSLPFIGTEYIIYTGCFSEEYTSLKHFKHT